MTRLSWGDIGKRAYEYGVDRVVFYPKNGRGYAWNGITSIKESTADASQSMIFVDGAGHANQLLLGQFAAVLEAITYPKEFEPFDGYSGIRAGQVRANFDFCYRTMQDTGYKIHLVYNCLAEPTDRNNSSLNQAPEMELFSWNLSTRPEVIPNARASSHFILDTTQVWPEVIQAMEDRLYGTSDSAPDMPTLPELLAIFDSLAHIKVIPHSDGTVTVIGPDENVSEIAPDLWKLEWPLVEWEDADEVRITSF